MQFIDAILESLVKSNNNLKHGLNVPSPVSNGFPRLSGPLADSVEKKHPSVT